VKPLRPDALTPTLSHREREKNEPPSTGRGERRAPFHGKRRKDEFSSMGRGGKTNPLPRAGGGKTSLLSWGERKDEPL